MVCLSGSVGWFVWSCVLHVIQEELMCGGCRLWCVLEFSGGGFLVFCVWLGVVGLLITYGNERSRKTVLWYGGVMLMSVVYWST